ncbi:glycoside hydrolase family 73 protein [Lactobacillus sp. YT155]|uniref:glycoside hydrolase family 73 protein n=1 Tax=Lactobacillus sp. YT155 TaxID=3060955 RepID=UPI00265F77BE|nr:glycoside hydrolase family 73 protein [Lactobacillus sp. YT155]MDO1605948.1 glycoside hydrolase family 73 protein [Lactobacillus sp. YT155]
MKKKLKKGLIVTSALSASMFNTPALITDAMAHAAETDAKETTTNTNKNNSTNNVENNNQTNTENDTVDKNTDTDKNTEVKNTVNDSDKVSKDSSIGPGYYSQPNTKAKSLLSSFSTAVPASTSSFINSVANGAVNGWKKYKVLPSVTIAQAILESAWGGSALTTKANNLFGIKGRYNGQYVTMPTWEVINGHSVMVNAEFRKYPSRGVSMEDHGNFLTVNSRYRNLIGVTNYRTVTKLLQQDGYATDPAYPGKLNSIIETYGLTKYDDIAIDPNVGNVDVIKSDANSVTTSGWHATSKSTN